MPLYDMSTDLITLGVYLVRQVVSVYLRCRRVWASPTDEHMSRTCHLSSRRLQKGELVPTPVILETWTRGSQAKTWVQYSGDTILDHPSPFELFARTPWIWIGYKTASGDMIDLTTEIAHYVVPGNCIKPELIHTLFPRSESGSVVYVDAETFKVNDLSSNGLVIEDGSSSIPPYSESTFISNRGGVCATPDTSGAAGVDDNTATVD